MCDSVSRPKWAVWQGPLKVWWAMMGVVSETNEPWLQPSVQVTYHCTLLPCNVSPFWDCVGTVSLVFNLKWSNRERQDVHGKEERKISRGKRITRMNSVPWRRFQCVFLCLLCTHPLLSDPHIHPLAFSPCMSGTHAPSLPCLLHSKGSHFYFSPWQYQPLSGPVILLSQRTCKAQPYNYMYVFRQRVIYEIHSKSEKSGSKCKNDFWMVRHIAEN